MLMLIAFLAVNVNTADAQFSKPRAPKLSLTGDEAEYNEQIFPTGEIWLPPNEGQPREFLLPVFIQHQQWYSYWFENNNLVKYIVKPIESFQFSLFYNETAVRAVDIVTSVPEALEEYYDEPLAKNFFFSVDDHEDDYYWNYLNPQHDDLDKKNGRRFNITGTSNTPLPIDNPRSTQHKLLLFVKFKVLYTNEPGQQTKFNKTSPIYIDNREIFFNEVNFTSEPAWKNMLEYNKDLYQIDYPGPSQILTGLSNDRPSLQNIYQQKPYQPGTIWLIFSDQSPEFSLSSTQDEISPVDGTNGMFAFKKPVTVDMYSPDPEFGSRVFKLDNRVSTSRLNNILIESDQDWLSFRTVAIGTESKLPNPIDDYTRKGRINYIDNGIIGIIEDPLGELARKSDGDVFIEIKCDPAALDAETEAEKTGKYVGYLTFSSNYAGESPIRLRVEFIYFRSPFEPAFDVEVPGGIYLTMSNGNQARSLVFGTGKRGTEGVDSLYGEFAYQNAMSSNAFDARFFPVPENDAIPFGFGDFAAAENARRTSSRDIRDYDNKQRSIIYNVKFNRVDDNLPVIIEWDIRRFPPGSQLFIRDALNGLLFDAVNMRQATVVDQFTRSFTIVDPRVEEFIIEYTLPSTINFVDENGDPIIKKGWNFLSLPVRPVSRKPEDVYTAAKSGPYYYAQNNYPKEDEMRVGYGYFVKYGDYIDVSFPGTYIDEISNDTPPFDNVRLYPGDKNDPGTDEFGGWNAIGALSTPTSTDGIQFTQFQDERPDENYTLRYSVWAYNTDRGYYKVSTMLPGLGHWIKVNKNGYLKLVNTLTRSKENAQFAATKEAVINRSVNVEVKANGSETELFISPDRNLDNSNYELPPVPGKGMFDARFQDNTYLTNSDNPVVRIQGADFPAVLKLNNANATYKVVDATTGKVFGMIHKGSNGSVEIDELPYGYVTLEKVNDFAQPEYNVYPNPVETSATVQYNVPQESAVTVKLFDQLGNEIETLVDNEVMSAGNYSSDINAGNLSAGTYVVHIQTGNIQKVLKVNVVK